MMRLYGSFTSPYTRKARVVALEKELRVDVIAVDVSKPGNAALAFNPLGKVPVLEREDGSALFDSPVIVEYLDSLKSPALIPLVGESRWQVLRWAALADGMMDATIARMLESRRAPEQQSPDSAKKQEGKIAQALAYAERELSGRVWLVEDRLTLADIALACALEYIDLRYTADWRAQHKRLAAWLEPVSERPAMVETRPPRT